MKRFIAIIVVLSLIFTCVSFNGDVRAEAAGDGLVSYKFDLGGLGAADGYIGVSADDVYSDDVGYGFGASSAVKNVAASGKGALADAVQFLDAANTKRAFKVKLDPGVYKITVTTGDVESATITAENMEQLYFLTGSNATDSFTIPVVDGCLEIYICQGVGGNYSMSAIEIEQVAADDENKPTIWIYGDSTVCNYYNVDDSHIHGWGQYLKEYIDTEKFDVRNMAINGMSAKLLNTHESFELAEYYGKPGDYFVLSIGINDYRSSSISSSDYTNAITSLCNRAKAKGMKVYLVKQQGMIRDIRQYPVIEKQWYSDEIDQVAKAVDGEVINLFQSWLEFSLEKTDEILPQYYATNIYGSTDEIHQNLKGAKLLAEMVAEELFPIEEEAGESPDKYDSLFSSSSTITYNVEEDGTGPMKNPHKGFVMDVGAPYQFEANYFTGTGIGGAKDNHAWDVVSICYGVQLWNELNPEKGVYNWKPIDDMLEACEKYGMTYGIRILPYSTGSGSDDNYGKAHNFVPQWVFDDGAVMDRVTYKYGHEGVEIDIPQWSNEHYISAYKEFVKALAEKYDGDPRVEFVEIRPFGNFGEWHTSQFVGNDMPSIDQQKDMLKFFADSFKKTTLQALSDVKGEVYDYALSIGISKRNDGLIMTPNEEWDLRPVYRANLPVAGDYHNQYKYMRYTLQENNPANYLLWTPTRFVETIEIPHLTMLSIDMDSTFGYQIYQEEKDLLDKMSHRMGYNFVVTEAKRNGNKLLVKIKNNGLAPAFFDIDLCAEILDENGNKIKAIGVPVTIPSGSFHDDEEKAYLFECSDSIPCDATICLAMYESAKGRNSDPTVKFDNKNTLTNNRLKLTDGDSHKIKKTVIAPTFAEEGYTLCKCENCDYNYKEDFVDELTLKFEMNDSSLVLPAGGTHKLDVTCNNPNANIIYASSDDSVVSVSDKGVVTAHKYGKATISATLDGKVLTSEVSVLFNDATDSSMYYYKPIYWAADAGITKGYSGVYFGVNENCTRSAVMIFLWRVKGCPLPKGDARKYFNDVTSAKNTDTNKAIAWAYENNIAKGYSDGSFGVNRDITRAEVMIMLYRIAGKPSATGNMTFSDCKGFSKTSDTYKSILWGYKNGITRGYDDGSFGVVLNCHREDIITFIYRYCRL